MNNFILKVKRADTPFYAFLKGVGRAVFRFQIPIPRLFDPVYKAIIYYRQMRYETSEKLAIVFFRYPIFRVVCTSIGERLRMEKIPRVSGNPRIYIGNDVYLSGTLRVSAGRIFPDPELRIGDRTFIGDGCSFAIAKSIEVGSDVLIASGCSLSDYSAHPVDPVKRVAGLQVEPHEVRPIRIGNRAWLGRGATILPGVSIGDDAVVGAVTVVTKDVPAGCICVGNPGRILTRTVYDQKPGSEPRAE